MKAVLVWEMWYIFSRVIHATSFQSCDWPPEGAEANSCPEHPCRTPLGSAHLPCSNCSRAIPCWQQQGSTFNPTTQLQGVSLGSWVSLLRGWFFCELVAWWDMARELLVGLENYLDQQVPVSLLCACRWVTCCKVNLKQTNSHLFHQFSSQHPQFNGMSLSLWPMNMAGRIYALNVNRRFDSDSFIEY